MGLDMYLSRKIYIGGQYDFNNVKGEIDISIRGKKVPLDMKKISYIQEEVAYWRKANAIHKWFVDNVQEGTDDCRSYYVSIKQLEKLKETCEKVVESLKNSTKNTKQVEIGYRNGEKIYADTEFFIDTETAREFLPCQEGFFFGSTLYDKYYLQDLEYTIKALEEILEHEKTLSKQGIYSDFEYRASW